MHFADIWFVLTVSENNIIHVLKNICKNVTLYARIIQILSKYLSELIGFWMWPQSQSPCVQLITSPIFEDNWAGGNYGEGDTGHEQHEQMNCMSFMSRPLTPAFPRASDIPLHSAPHTMYVVTGSGQSSLSIFLPLFDRIFSPLWLGEICLRNGGCDVCQGLTQHFT